MANWNIYYWTDETNKSPVEVWFDDLTKEQLKCITKELLLLELSGNNLKLPHS